MAARSDYTGCGGFDVIYRFGDFELSPDAYELRRAGSPVHLEPRVVEVLAELLAHRDRVVGRRELFERLWPDQVVSETALTSAVRDARRALGDSGSTRRWIETVHGRGFRFAGEVEEVLPSAVETERPEGRPGIVVLPLEDLSGDPGQAYFADGLTEALTTELAGIRSLKVISRTSAMHYKGVHRPLAEIAGELDVEYAVEGSVLRVGDRVRITAQLLHASRDEHLWAQSYDRNLGDVFAIQSDVALKIATALRAALSPDEKKRLTRYPTRNLRAYQLYLQGRHSFGRYTAEGVRRGIEALEQAVVEDPEFALAHVGLAKAYAEAQNEGYLPLAPAQAIERARVAVERALELDPELGEAHGLVALLLFICDHDWEGAEREFRRALELSPGSADIYDHYGWLCEALGRGDDAVRLLRTARELDPLTHQTDLASTLLRAGRIDEALKLAERVLAFDPGIARGHSVLGWAHLLAGRFERGIEALERAVEISAGGTLFRGQLGQAYAMAGRTEDAERILAELLRLREERYVSPYHLAYVCTGLGRDDEAVAWLERAYEDRAQGVAGIRGSYLFRSLHGHPGFVALLRKMNLA